MSKALAPALSTPTDRPIVKAGQIWSAVTPRPEGRRYIRIVRVRKKGTGYNYAKAVEITAKGVLIPSPVEAITISLASGEMASDYKFESEKDLA